MRLFFTDPNRVGIWTFLGILTILSLIGLLLSSIVRADESPTLTDVQVQIDIDYQHHEIITPERQKLLTLGQKFLANKDTIWQNDSPNEDLLARFVRGIFRSRTLKPEKGSKASAKIRWERCGAVVPEDQLIIEATDWAATILASLEAVKAQTNISVNPWGVFATIANESSFDECALNYAIRVWASRHVGRELITETWKSKTVQRKVTKKVVKRFRLTYDKETVWRIIHHPDFAKAKVTIKNKRTGLTKTIRLKNKFDGGPMQLRKSVRKLSREEFDEIMSVHPGVYIGIKEMARRAKDAMHRYRLKKPLSRPWLAWPGWNINHEKNLKYDRQITMVARWLGAKRDEI